MTSLLYISYSSKLTEAEKLIIDKKVGENRISVSKFVKKVLLVFLFRIYYTNYSLGTIKGAGSFNNEK